MALYTIPSSGSGTGAVKSVQRGTYTSSSGGVATPISISTINPTKSIVILNGGMGYYGVNYTYSPYVMSLTSITLYVFGPYYYGSSYVSLPGSWQIIEYV